MYAHLYNQNDDENRKNGTAFSILLHLLLLLLLFLPFVTASSSIQSEFEGIIVAIGIPDAGTAVQTSEQSTPPAEAAVVEEKKAEKKPVEEKKLVAAVVEKQEVKSEITQEKSEVTASEKIEVVIEEQLKPVKIKEKPVDTEAEKRKAEAERKAREEAEKKAQQEAEEKARKQQLEASKNKFGSLLGNGSSGSQDAAKGVENGSPDASALEGISTGKGSVGEGLDSRGILYEPVVTDNSQKTGKVVVKICVNSAGEVTSSKYTQKGSSTTDQYLVDLAERNAKKYKFSPSSVAEQCGSITINFVLE